MEAGWLVGTHAGFFFGSSESAVKKQQGQILVFFWSSSWIEFGGVSLICFLFRFWDGNQVPSNHERHFGRFYNDNSGSSYCVYDFWSKKNCFRPQFFSYCPMIQPSDAFTFSYGGNLLRTKNLPLCHPLKATKKPSTGSAKNWSYFIKLDKAALVLFKEYSCWGNKFPGPC